MPTVIGVLFMLACLGLFFLKGDELFALVVFSAIFQSSSVVALEQSGIEPYFVVAAFFVLQSIYRRILRIPFMPGFSGRGWMIAFCVIAILSAFTLPFLFAGTPVYDQHVGIDEGLFIRPPLQFSSSNVSHSVSLLLGVLVVLGASQQAQGTTSRKSYLFTFYFLAGMVTVQFLCAALGVEFPYTLLQNHAGKSMQIAEAGDLSARFPGTFTESSAAGQLFSSFTIGFLADYLKHGRSKIPLLIGTFAILLVRSTGSIAAFLLTAAFLVMSQRVIRWPGTIDWKRFKRVAILLLAGAVAIAAVLASPLGSSLFDVTVNKQESSSSLVNRTAADLYGLELLLQTDGLGVGMGSNRPSSLIVSLLSTVGAIGLIVFVIMYFKLLSNAREIESGIWWGGIAFFISLATSGPDYDMPWLWVLLALSVAIRPSRAEPSNVYVGNMIPADTGSL